MEKLITPGRMIYAFGLLGLGILCIISKDFIVGRPPAWPDGFFAASFIGYATAAFIFLSAMALIFNRNAVLSMYLLALIIFALSFTRHLAQFSGDWLNGLKALALLGGALIIASSFYDVGDRVSTILLSTGTFLIGVFFIGCGYAHFKFADFVQDFIPAYIPFRLFWTYFCGVCLIAGGVGMTTPFTRKWAALLSGIMLAGWFFMLHIPRFLANVNDVSDRLGLFESFALAGICFVVAGLASTNKNKVLSNSASKFGQK
jgi:hypothetical protein